MTYRVNPLALIILTTWSANHRRCLRGYSQRTESNAKAFWFAFVYLNFQSLFTEQSRHCKPEIPMTFPNKVIPLFIGRKTHRFCFRDRRVWLNPVQSETQPVVNPPFVIIRQNAFKIAPLQFCSFYHVVGLNLNRGLENTIICVAYCRFLKLKSKFSAAA